MSKHAFYITGTDTEVGKTFVATLILRAVAARGMSVVGLKPVAAGCEYSDGELKNEDALELIAASSVKLPYRTVNPIALEPAIAPHIASQHLGKSIDMHEMLRPARAVLSGDYDVVLIEGAGGWFVPLNYEETLADLCIQLNLPVILVVGIKLGCINHALLSVAAIREAGVKLAGWVANSPWEAIPEFDENVQSISDRVAAPCLGVIPYVGDATRINDSELQRHMDLEHLLHL